MKYIADWRDKKRNCYFCGTNLSVKYEVTFTENDDDKIVSVCNKCVFLYAIR